MDPTLQSLLEKLVQGKVEQDNKILEANNKLVESNSKLEELIGALKAPDADAAQIRKDLVQKLTLNFHKVRKTKYKVSHDIKLFLKVFEEEIVTAKSGVGFKEDLKKEEWVPIFRASLDFPVVERVKVLLKGKAKDWDTIEIKDLKQIMLDEFGSKQTDVAQVLNMFGQHRLVKKPDESVTEFYFRWDQNLPENMKPSGNQVKPYEEFVDLIHRSLFYIALNDEELQKALSDMKDAEPTLTKYLKEACLAETRRDTFKNIAKSAISSEDRGVSISRFESGQWTKSDKSDKSGKSSAQGAKPKDKSKTGNTNANSGDKGQNYKPNNNKKSQKQDSTT